VDNIKSPENSDFKELIKKYSPFIKEIRKRILLTLVVLAFSSILGFIFYDKIIRFLLDLLSLNGINIVFTSPFQFINLAISCGVAAGLVIAVPFFIYQVLSFLKPALKFREFKMVVKSLPLSIILFLCGFSFGFYIMKWQIKLFLEKSIALGIGNILDVSSLISTVLLVSVFMGVAFQFPIIIFILMRLGFVKRRYLARQRMWIYVGSLFFTILLPADSITYDASYSFV